MKKKVVLAILMALLLLAAFGGAALAQTEDEAPTTFYLEAAHRVQGNQIGLSRETPVVVGVIRNGLPLTYVRMNFGDRVGAELPVGVYELTFTNTSTGDLLFTCGPYTITDALEVRVQAHEKGPGRVPACYVKIFD